MTLRKIKSLAEAPGLREAARFEKHGVLAPSHVVERDGRLVGYASLNRLPLLTGWLSDEEVSQAEGREIIAQLEAEARAAGLTELFFPCTPDCRFLPDMAAMGYHRAGPVTLYLKPLTL